MDPEKFKANFGDRADEIESIIASLGQSSLASHAVDLRREGFTKIFQTKTRLETFREHRPHVVEPSFGMGRILYALLEQVYWHREGRKAKEVLSFPAPLAPYQVLVLPQKEDAQLNSFVKDLGKDIRKALHLYRN